MLAACQHADCDVTTITSRTARTRSYLGMDVARVHDLCVLDVGEKSGRRHLGSAPARIKAEGRFPRSSTSFYRLLELPAMVRGCIDATGMGMQLAERARDRFGCRVDQSPLPAPLKSTGIWAPCRFRRPEGAYPL